LSRAVVFIDGANLYSSLKAIGVWANRIDPYRVARKLVESRSFVEARYYIAEINRAAPEHVYRAFRNLIALLGKYPEVRLCLGHIQETREANPCAHDISPVHRCGFHATSCVSYVPSHRATERW
jgi:hypothetical protein